MMRKQWLVIVSATYGVSDWFKSLNNLLVSLPQIFVGSRETAFGGLNFPRDSRQYALFQWAPGYADGSYYFMNADAPEPANCPAHKDTIEGVEELDNWSEEWLECLLLKGKVPEKLEPGFYYGKAISRLGSDVLTDFANAVWGGFALAETKCDGDSSVNALIGFNQVGNSAAIPTWNYIGSEPLNGWKFYGKNSTGDWWWMDWTVDFTDVCPSRVHPYYDTAGEDGTTRERRIDPRTPASANSFQPGLLPHLTGGPGSYLRAQVYTIGSLNNAAQIVRDRVGQIRQVGIDRETNGTLYLGRVSMLFPEGLRPTSFFTFYKHQI